MLKKWFGLAAEIDYPLVLPAVPDSLDRLRHDARTAMDN
jgi:hypothetical protein